MEVKDLEKYFDFDILRRGYDYYKKGKVVEICESADGFLAKVRGTETYKVLLDLDKNPYQMSCSCPYENACKHMAAVLYCLKNDTIPISQTKNMKINEEITDFDKFKKEFKKEYNKLFHNKYSLNANEIDGYVKFVGCFAKKGVTYIKTNPDLAYEIFVFLLLEIDNIDVTVTRDYDYYYDDDDEYEDDDCIEFDKESLFNKIFNDYKKILNNKDIFDKFLIFIYKIHTTMTEDFYFNHTDRLLDLLFNYINSELEAKKLIVLLNKMYRDKSIYDRTKQKFIVKRVLLTYKFIDKDEALREAEKCLDIPEICDLLTSEYRNDTKKLIDVLKKIIDTNDGWRSKKYAIKLLEIYKEEDEVEYIKLLKNEFIKHGDISTYKTIKNYYSVSDWQRLKKEYLNQVVKNRHLYREICLEEGYYDELLQSLEGEWIEVINVYLDILEKQRPKEIVELYKKAILNEVVRSSSRPAYQKTLNHLVRLTKMPKLKDEVAYIIKYIRENHRNKKAFQEELDFFEDTFL